MKIIILGAGQVGSTLAASLSNDENDITLIDQRQDLLDKLQEKHDLRVLKGNGASPRKWLGRAAWTGSVLGDFKVTG